MCLPTERTPQRGQACEQAIRIKNGPMGRIQSARWSAHQWPDTPWGVPAFELLILASFDRANNSGWNDRARLASMPSVQCDVHLIGLNAIRSASRGVDNSVCTTSRHARIHSNSSSLHVNRGGCSSHHVDKGSRCFIPLIAAIFVRDSHEQSPSSRSDPQAQVIL